MGKKGQNKGKKGDVSVNVPGSKQRTAQGRVYDQKRPDQKVRRQHNKRIEFVLNPAYDEDRKMIALLTNLEGGKSDYIREALALKMEADKKGDPVAQLETLFQELDEQRRRYEELQQILLDEIEKRPTVAEYDRGVNAILERLEGFKLSARERIVERELTLERPPTLPESGTVPSSGLDMSRPRPRPAARVINAPQAEAMEELTEQEAIRLAKIMANSIKNANPGRSQ